MKSIDVKIWNSKNASLCRVFANRVTYESSVFALQQIIIFVCGVHTEHFVCVMVLFNNTPYKRMRLTNKINLKNVSLKI